MKKVVENSITISREARQVLHYLTSSYTIKKIAKKLNKSDKTIYKHFSKLRKKGIINKYREISPNGRKLLSSPTMVESFRTHNIRLTIDIPKHINFSKIRYNFLTLKKISYEKHKLGKADYGQFVEEKAIVRVFRDKIVLILPSILGLTPQETTENLMDSIVYYIRKLEKVYKIDLLKDEALRVRITSNEYAHIRDELAKKYRNDGNNFFLYDDEKKLRLIIDFSGRIDELEAVHKDYAESDQIRIQRHLMDILKNNPPTNSELAIYTRDLIESVKTLSESESFNREQITQFSKNLELHLSVLKEIKEAIKDLRMEIKKSKK